jgi:hypothetical protein
MNLIPERSSFSFNITRPLLPCAVKSVQLIHIRNELMKRSKIFGISVSSIGLCLRMLMSSDIPRLVSIIEHQGCHCWGVAIWATRSQSWCWTECSYTVSSIGTPVLGNTSMSGGWLSVSLLHCGRSSARLQSSRSDADRLTEFRWRRV